MNDAALTALIRQRAYQIWESEGSPSGRHLQHWLQAEAELRGGAAAGAPKSETSVKRAVRGAAAGKPKAPAAPKRPRLSH